MKSINVLFEKVSLVCIVLQLVQARDKAMKGIILSELIEATLVSTPVLWSTIEQF